MSVALSDSKIFSYWSAFRPLRRQDENAAATSANGGEVAGAGGPSSDRGTARYVRVRDKGLAGS